MGNFISNQRSDAGLSRYTEQGMIAVVDLSLMKSSGEILSVEARALPTWVDKYRVGEKNAYAIVPLAGAFEENEALWVSGHAERAAEALEDCRALFGEEALYD
jgi:hypothetical protein